MVQWQSKKMIAGDSIGFLPGTGIGHTFINNSNSDVELFVAGDRTKKENQYRFHLEPKFKAWVDIVVCLAITTCLVSAS